MAAHSMIADKKSGVPQDALQALRSHKPISDPKLHALYTLTQEMVRTQGNPSSATVQSFLANGFSERHILYIVLAIAVKTLSNFSNHAFGTPLDERFAAYRVD
jgi:alkylhydroperoxidase family enzyme